MLVSSPADRLLLYLLTVNLFPGLVPGRGASQRHGRMRLTVRGLDFRGLRNDGSDILKIASSLELPLKAA